MRCALPLPLLALLLPSTLKAETLTWQQVLEEARRNSPVLRSAEASVDSNEALVRSTQSENLPQLSANFAANYGKNSQIRQDPDDSYSATLQLSQSIFNGWQTTARVEQSRVNVSIAETQLDINKAQLSSDLKTAFADLIYAQRAIRLQESIRDRRKANLDLVELRFQNGAENKGSGGFFSRAYLQEAELRLFQAQNSIDSARAQLGRAIGRNEIRDLKVDENLPLSDLPVNPDLQKLALETPQSRQAVFREQVADTSITLARAGYFPSLALNGSYGKQDTVFFPENEAWSVGVSLTIPLFHGGRDYYSTQSAISSRTVAGANREDIDRQLLVTLQQTLSRLEEAKRAVEVSKAFLSAAEMRSEIGRSRYNNGLLSFEDWDLIESDLISRQQATIQSQRDYSIAEAAWENAIGKGNIP